MAADRKNRWKNTATGCLKRKRKSHELRHTPTCKEVDVIKQPKITYNQCPINMKPYIKF